MVVYSRTFKYGKGLLKNIYLIPFKRFVGFENAHLPIAYCKSTFRKVWEADTATLHETSKHRFRQHSDVNQWLMRYWQLASGNFEPISPNIGHYFEIGRDNREIAEAIKSQSYKIMCLGDVDVNLDFEAEKERLRNLFETILPVKSSFEL